MTERPTPEQIAEILAFEASYQTRTATLWSADELASAGTGDRFAPTAAHAAYDMAGWTTVANRKRSSR